MIKETTIKQITMDEFKKTIKKYLDARARKDTMFAEAYANKDKSIDGCCNYIISEVRKTKRQAFADEEIYGMAVHYYDEKDIKDVGPQNGCTVKISGKNEGANIPVELTEEDREKARQEAYEQLVNEYREKASRKKKAAKPAEQEQPTLF